MAPPPSTAVSPVVSLVIRVLTFVFLLASVIVIATNTVTADLGQAKFSDFYAYRYLLASGVIGMAYTLLQTAFAVYYVSTGNRLGGDGLSFLDFYGEKALSYMLATGAAAGFGLTVDWKHAYGATSFFDKANAAASLLLVGFVFSAVSSVFSSLSLPKGS